MKNEKKKKIIYSKLKQIFIYENIYNIRQQTTTTKKIIIQFDAYVGITKIT